MKSGKNNNSSGSNACRVGGGSLHKQKFDRFMCSVVKSHTVLPKLCDIVQCEPFILFIVLVGPKYGTVHPEKVCQVIVPTYFKILFLEPSA